MAMSHYYDVHGRLPPAVVYGEGDEPLYSWRVLLLPFLEENALYQQFKLGEPWDSPDNLQLLSRMPPVYGPFREGASSPPYSTFYRVFFGSGAAFEGHEGLRLRDDFPDGTSETILIVEAGDAVPWTKPEELIYDPRQTLPSLGGISKDGFRAALADGSVHIVKRNTSERTLRALITRNGGDKPGPDWSGW
jgi:hypothetical protein